MTDDNALVPTKITLHKRSRTLEIEFNNGEQFVLPCAYLRAFSLSAEMRYDKPKAADVVDYSNVNILSIEPVGHYAIKPIFSDGHRTGIFSWRVLYDLGVNLKKNWPLTKGNH